MISFARERSAMGPAAPVPTLVLTMVQMQMQMPIQMLTARLGIPPG